MEVFVFVWIGSAVLCWIVANSKARFAGIWFLLGLLFGPLSLIAVAVMPSLEKDKFAPSPRTHVKCPDCRELVIKDARICKHCGCKLVPQP